jgi:outer membrane immunogenic protein
VKKTLLASVSIVALLLARPSLAADLSKRMPVKAPPMAVPPPVFSWTGCYIGGHIGGGWGRKTITDTPDSLLVAFSSFESVKSVEDNTSGFLGGGQVGCNYQFAVPWVIGIEGDISAANLRGNVTSPFSPHSVFSIKTNWLASVTPRLGYAWDRWLLYVKGGVAWDHDSYSAQYLGTYTASETPSGWTIGAGLEWAFADNWSAKFEYDYYDFGSKNVTFNNPNFGPPVGTQVETVKQTIQAVKFGINYRFGGPWPVTAHY